MLLRVDGFDGGEGGWDYVHPAMSSQPTLPRTGTHSLYSTNSDGNAEAQYGLVPIQTVIVGWAIYMTNITTNFLFYLRRASQNRTHIGLRRGAAGEIDVFRSTSTLLGDTDPGVFPLNTWVYIELKVTISDTVGAVALRVNGVTPPGWTDLTNVDTRDGGTDDAIDTVHLRAGGSVGTSIDDVYIADTTGGVNDDFLGDCRVYKLLPSGNGNYSQLVGSDGNSVDNYALVDESPASATDYVGSATPGEKDTYQFADLPIAVGVVHGVQVETHAFKSDAGAISMRRLHRRNSVDSAGADLGLGTDMIRFRDLLDVDPSDSGAWTIARVNDSEFGAEVRS